MTAASVDVEVAEFGTSAVTSADPADLIHRDRWGRPEIPGPDGKVVGHTRASSAGKPLEDTTRLVEWKERQVVVGTLQSLLDETQAQLAELGSVDADGETDEQRRERNVAIGMLTGMAQGLMLRLEAIGPEPDKDLVDEGRAWKKSVDAIVEQAHAAAGSHDRADLGTYLHAVLDARYQGIDIPPIPERFAARYSVAARDRDVAATDAATAGWIPLCRERFVVCDPWTIAGTLDSLSLIPIDLMVERTTTARVKITASRLAAKNKKWILAWLDRRLDNYAAWKAEGVLWVMVVDDFKSGRTMNFGGLAYTAQVAAYADGVFYDPETQERSAYTTVLPSDIDPATVRIDTETAIIVHTPVGEGVCRIYDVPLDEGRAALAMASDVRAMRNSSRNWLQLTHEVAQPREVDDIEPVRAEAGRVDRIDSLIRGCQSIAELLALRERELAPVMQQKYGEMVPVVPWTAQHEEVASAQASLLKAGMVGPDAKAAVDYCDRCNYDTHTCPGCGKPLDHGVEVCPECTAENQEPAAVAVDPVLAEIARADSISLLRGVFAVYKAEWTPERDAAAAARAEQINQAKAQQVA